VIIESRGGAVLGAVTILKEDYFPGMKSSRLPQLLPGGAACCCLPFFAVVLCPFVLCSVLFVVFCEFLLDLLGVGAVYVMP
jgi:hypothetical protein